VFYLTLNYQVLERPTCLFLGAWAFTFLFCACTIPVKLWTLRARKIKLEFILIKFNLQKTAILCAGSYVFFFFPVFWQQPYSRAQLNCASVLLHRRERTKNIRIYKFSYDTLFIQIFTVISSNGNFNALMSTGNDIRHLMWIQHSEFHQNIIY